MLFRSLEYERIRILPTRAEHDPNAPWNEKDSPEWEGEFEYEFNKDGVLEITLEIKDGIPYILDPDYLFDSMEENEWEWWEDAMKSKEIRNGGIFLCKLMKLINDYVEDNNIEWEWEDPQDAIDAAAEDAFEAMRDEQED